ncbi:sortase [Candidatus Saccharibacteria bacterium]|nr:sortase [Candidatus Saccharibacteria bacterium]MCL1962762.1 sortase [Candidatus Saccharibacteria bacterium]
MVGDRHNPQYHRVLSSAPRVAHVAVPAKHVVHHVAPVQQTVVNNTTISKVQAQPAVQQVAVQSQPQQVQQVQQAQPMQPQNPPVAPKFHPVIEERSPIIHMEDLFNIPSKPAQKVAAPVQNAGQTKVVQEAIHAVQVAQPVQPVQVAQSVAQPVQPIQYTQPVQRVQYTQGTQPQQQIVQQQAVQQQQQPQPTTAIVQAQPQLPQVQEPQPSTILPYIDAQTYSPFTPISKAVGGEVKKESGHITKFAKHIAGGATKTAKHVHKLAKHLTGKKKSAAQTAVQAATSLASQFTPGVSPSAFLSPASGDDSIFQSVAPAPRVNVTEQVLASATSQQPTVRETPNMPTTVDSYGAVAIADDGFLGKLSRLSNTKITFSINIKKKQVFAILRTILILTILAISGYLAWDTWMTNREAHEMFSSPTSTLSINSIAAVDADNPDALDTTSVSNQAITTHSVPADQPRYISIPAIGVKNARVFSVGVNSDGNIDVPKNVNDAAWYDGSAKPGQNGAVFIDGHTSFSRSYKGIFDDLGKLNVDDKITIERGDGKSFTYKIVNKETKPRSEVDMNKALNVQGGAAQGLTLMTCAGRYDYRSGSASDRLIIYAVLE